MFSLEFQPLAAKEWKELDRSVSCQFSKILNRRLIEPRVESARLSGNLEGMYKISLRKVGYRMIYEIDEEAQVVRVVAIGKRANKEVYFKASKRLGQIDGGEEFIGSDL